MIEMGSFGRIFSLLFVPIPLELYRVLTFVYSGVPGVVTSYSLTSLSGRWPLIYNRKLITIKTLMHVLMIFLQQNVKFAGIELITLHLIYS